VYSDKDRSGYHLNEKGEFIIDNYNSAKPFSSFFPGMAGINGIPMWVFYVNRGQCISGMGVRDKDHPIMEFLPANRAYNLTGSHGFRTFIKLSSDSPIDYYEPFQNYYRDNHLDRTQRMIIRPSHLILEEINDSINIGFTVEYFTVPHDTYAGLVRILRIHNPGSSRVELTGLDGLPVIVPYGVDDFCLKSMRRTIEAFIEVRNLENRVPFYKAKVEPTDSPDVIKINKGNFYIGFETKGSATKIVNPIVDPGSIFGNHTDYGFPERFVEMSGEDIIKDQLQENQFPCAMGIFTASIPPGESYTYFSIIGNVSSLEKLNEISGSIARRDYIQSRAVESQNLTEKLTQHNLICSAEPALDHYVRQNFLDNCMRGGFPYTLAGDKNRSTLYLYSRKHGDMERDYNEFRLMPTQFSQGNGNFRDINQNRRSDLFFNPVLGKENVRYFYNLIQLDGFNPLVLKEDRFAVNDFDKTDAVLRKYSKSDDLQQVISFMKEPFTPGELLAYLDEKGVSLNVESEIFIGAILDHCRKMADTDYGEGYWIDHWTYNLDLLENYLAVYPEEGTALLFRAKEFSFYDNPHVVQSRDDKCVLWSGKAMQLTAVILDEEKAELIAKRNSDVNLVRVEYGQGEVYYTTLFIKILCLIVNKLASLDPDGIGVEMEAGKPGWYDALNGMPGLFGSSICETLEIKRHILFLKEIIGKSDRHGEKVLVFEELKKFLDEMQDILCRRLSPFEFWDASSRVKEDYREKTRPGINGKEVPVEIGRIEDFFEAALDKLSEGIEKGLDDKSKTISTYFRYEVTDYEPLEVAGRNKEKKQKLNAQGLPCIRPLKFRQVRLPLFLEGPVHFLRCLPGKETARKFVSSVKKSDLYDRSLKMYKVNTSLAGEPMEIGRARVFAPGWLENESIWLHMEYKYMLELLRNGLYDEFFADFKNIFIPFLDPEVYGRSILENSSFIVSSVYPNASLHGNGFVARLTGATAEFINILHLMTMGPRPFRLGKTGELQFGLRPSLPDWLFTESKRKLRICNGTKWQEIEVPAGSFSFMLLGKIVVTYHNRERKNTYGDGGVVPVKWRICDNNGKEQEFEGPEPGGDMAIKIRERKVSRINVELG